MGDDQRQEKYMKSQAIYVGKRDYNREQRTTEDGEIIPALKGRQYIFCCADWAEDKEHVESIGKTRYETIEEKEVEAYEAKLPTVGGFCTVSIREVFDRQRQPDNLCKFVKIE